MLSNCGQWISFHRSVGSLKKKSRIKNSFLRYVYRYTVSSNKSILRHPCNTGTNFDHVLNFGQRISVGDEIC